VAVGADALSADALRSTLGALLKNRDDLDRAQSDPGKYR
jgi:hypothetical protein